MKAKLEATSRSKELMEVSSEFLIIMELFKRQHTYAFFDKQGLCIL